MKIASLCIKANRCLPQIIKCSLTDHFAFRAPVPIAFFYRQHIPTDLIISALQHVLSDFQIFAGTLIRKSGDLYIDCNNRGVALTITKHDGLLFERFSDFDKMDQAFFVEKINPYKTIKAKEPVLKIKLSYYQEGMVIGYCWHHSLGDMSTFMGFVKALSAFCQNKTYEKPLVVEDRQQFLKDLPLVKQKLPVLKLLNICDIFAFFRYFLTPKKTLHISFTEQHIANLREELSQQLGKKISRNDAICAYLLNSIANCRRDRALSYHAAVIINLRSRLALSPKIQGNFVDIARVQVAKSMKMHEIASQVHTTVKEFQPIENFNFVQEHGGMKNIERIIPEAFLPKYKTLLITNWTNFDVYSIDFGITAPCFVTPIGISPIPYVASIVEGFANKGLLVALILPTRLAKQIAKNAS